MGCFLLHKKTSKRICLLTIVYIYGMISIRNRGEGMIDKSVKAWNPLIKRVVEVVEYSHSAVRVIDDEGNKKLLNTMGVPILHCTGEVDCHGRPVFTGEIIKFRDEEGKAFYGEVVRKSSNIVRYRKNGQRYEEPLYNIQDFMIVGNIYETPELL